MVEEEGHLGRADPKKEKYAEDGDRLTEAVGWTTCL